MTLSGTDPNVLYAIRALEFANFPNGPVMISVGCAHSPMSTL